MKQDKALAILKSGRNVFLTGSAGSGKTYVLNQYIDYLKSRDISVGITASTGIAATHISGFTIHGWSGMGIRTSIDRRALNNLDSKKYLKSTMKEVKVLVIDEISMLHRKQFEVVNTILQFFKNSAKPFGGIQLVLSGDFFQLPPIGRDSEPSHEKFCFMSPTWVEADFAICYLTEQYRQSATKLTDVLNKIRTATVDAQVYELLNSRNVSPDHQEISKLFTHNVDVDRMNRNMLDKIDAKEHVFVAKTTGNAKLVEGLSKSILAGTILKLKVGAKVMFIKNNFEKGYVNGTIGSVVGFDDDGFPLIQTNTRSSITAEPELWELRNDAGRKIAGFEQIPLQLAWAITVHKSQGMTLDEAEIDLSKSFERGQGYVALSRLKSLDTLYLKGLNDKALLLDELAMKADKRFLELSNELDAQYTIQELEQMHMPFVEMSGGLRVPRKKGSYRSGKSNKKSTIEITLEGVKEQKTVEQIAKERDLSVSTIYGHLSKIKDTYPDTDLSFYRPDDSLVDRVIKTYYALLDESEEGVGLKSIYETLDGSVSYTDIKRCLLFRED